MVEAHQGGGAGVARRGLAQLAGIEICKLNTIDPNAWLTSTLVAIMNDQKQFWIGELLQWNYAQTV
jgi:hypothetical protein